MTAILVTVISLALVLAGLSLWLLLGAKLSRSTPLHTSSPLPIPSEAVHSLSNLTKAEAEDWLDWLEAHGDAPHAVACDKENGFIVHLK